MLQQYSLHLGHTRSMPLHRHPGNLPGWMDSS